MTFLSRLSMRKPSVSLGSIPEEQEVSQKDTSTRRLASGRKLNRTVSDVGQSVERKQRFRRTFDQVLRLPLARVRLADVRREPLSLKPHRWHAVEFPCTRNSNDQETAIGVRMRPKSRDLVIFLGGGEVSADASCTERRVSMPVPTLKQDLQNHHCLLDSGSLMGDANWVYVPAVNFDRHMGSNTATYGMCHHGACNFDEYLLRLVPSFPTVNRIVLAGHGAGGFGAQYLAPKVRQAFGKHRQLMVVNFAAPYLPDHELFDGDKVQAWGLQESVAPGWQTLLPSDADPNAGSKNIYSLTAQLSEDGGLPVRTAVVVTTRDRSTADVYNLDTEDFYASLQHLPAFMDHHDPNARLFVMNGSHHFNPWSVNERDNPWVPQQWVNPWGPEEGPQNPVVHNVSLTNFLQVFLEGWHAEHVVPWRGPGMPEDSHQA